jgi:phosphohistidine phosphatase SixA
VQPDDAPQWIRDRLRAETRDIAIAGHFPHLPRLIALLLGGVEEFPAHGVVALQTEDEGETWREVWRIRAEK